MGSVKSLLTAEEFLRMPPQEGKRFELDEGELVEMTFPNFRHNRIALRILLSLSSFLEKNRLGEVFVPDSGFMLNPSTVRGPDVSYLSNEKVKRLHELSNHFDGAPDLAVEVVSPSDTARDLQRKVDQYLNAGAHTVWVVYPDTTEVLVFGSDRSVRRLGPEDTLDAPVLLPGFGVKVQELFE